jgi:hypothetical protein
MHDWLMRNVSLLAFLLLLGILIFTGMSLVPLFIGLPRYISGAGSSWQLLIGGLAGILVAAMYLLGLLVAYGILLRFLALCDDIAVIRRQQTGTPSSRPTG